MKQLDYVSYVKRKAGKFRCSQEMLSAEARLEMWEILQAGYCKHCGDKLNDHPCPCVKDA